MTIHVCGEALVDLVPVRPGSLNPHVPALGGGPFNVAIAAARLGGSVRFQSRISRDGFGAELMRALEAEGVDSGYVQRGEEPTSLAVTTLAPDGSVSYNFYVEGTADRFVEPVYAPADIAYFGTVSLALEPGASRYAQLLRDFAQRGTLVALDPNIRPFYATDSHRAFLLGLLGDVGLLKLSTEEAEFLGPAALDAVAATVITRGEDGLSLRTPALRLDVPAVKTTVADTIGAGDTVMAALLAELGRREVRRADLADVPESDWEEMLTFAATAASLTVSRTGAQPPTRSDVEEHLS